MAAFEQKYQNGVARIVEYPVWFGGSASSMAVCVTHPLELVKVRMQVESQFGVRKGALEMVAHIVRNDGFLGLYYGLSAGFTRTLLYGTSRFALYETIKTYYQRQSQDPPTLSVLIPAAAASGFVGGIIGNPADLANVRMQCDRGLPLVSRRGYSHIFDAWIRMAKEEGWQCLMRGWGPNAIRAGLMTSSQLASYDSFKSMLTRDLGMGDNMRTHFASSVLASLVATTVCSPVDVIKTRIMSSSEPVSVPKLVRHISRAEGLRWMWRGWVPSFGRLGPQTVVTFMLLEQHKLLYRTLYGL